MHMLWHLFRFRLILRSISAFLHFSITASMHSCLLHLTPLPGRPAALADSVRGHFCNPMNQAELSRYPLSGLGTLYGCEERSLSDIYPTDVADLLARDGELFETVGLDGMESTQAEALAREYERIEHPAAAEVAAWLRGEYRFDPACLTG